MEVVNAIKYLADRKMFQDEEYKWIYPLISEMIRGCQITNKLVEEHIAGKIELNYIPTEVTLCVRLVVIGHYPMYSKETNYSYGGL